jgi:hypothetical protein
MCGESEEAQPQTVEASEHDIIEFPLKVRLTVVCPCCQMSVSGLEFSGHVNSHSCFGTMEGDQAATQWQLRLILTELILQVVLQTFKSLEQAQITPPFHGSW